MGMTQRTSLKIHWRSRNSRFQSAAKSNGSRREGGSHGRR